MTVLFFPDYTDTNPYQANLAAKIEEMDERVKMAPELIFLPLLRPVLAGEDVSVAHIHWFDTYVLSGSLVKTVLRVMSTLLELLALKLLDVPVVWTSHNIRFHESPYPRIEYVFKWAFLRVGLCSHVFVHCQATRDRLLETYGLSGRSKPTVAVVPHGHYIDNYENSVDSETARRELGVDSDGTTLLFFGLIRPYKNIIELVEAFKSVAEPNSRLMIVGKPVDDRIASTIRTVADDDSRIETILQFVPEDRIQFYMNAADAVVLPMSDADMSGSLILAMSFGKAVIVPRVGCIPEVVDSEGAVMYDGDSPYGLFDALTDVETQPLDEMGGHNYRLAERSDWTVAAVRTVQTYCRLCGQ